MSLFSSGSGKQTQFVPNLDDLNSLLPLLGSDGCVQCFDGPSSFDVMVDGCVQLFVLGQMVAPLFFQVHDLSWELSPG